ncbi:hypothetical protein [Kitasatospora acidiphila]|uniref:hypothetical protein n=1 Tax=Kitasatospora acidiphila TaxID=2567942 RepID=UPI003C78912F
MILSSSTGTVPDPAETSRRLLGELTNSGRVSFRQACSRLTVWESLLMQHLLGRDDIDFIEQPAPGEELIRVTRSALSGPAFWRPGEVADPRAESLGWLRVPPQVVDMVAEEAAALEAREAAELLEVEAVLRAWARGGELDHRLVQLADWVERVETVYVFVGRDVFSKSDAGSNTLTRDGLLASLRERAVETWRPADRLFVVLAYCLFLSGRSVRFEEFNGRQLSATRLRDYLMDRYVGYCAAVGRIPENPHGIPLLELAGRVRNLLAEVDRSEMMRYRRINGLTFAKNEYLTDFPLPRDPETMPELVAEFGRTVLGVAGSGKVRGDLRAMTLAAAELDAKAGPDGTAAGTGEQGAIGELLGAIVLSAILATDSDYGMSSSIRDLASLRGASPGGPEGVLALKKGDFFCCCLPHTTRMAATGDETVPILWRAAQRMMFNRWHFVPGEFDRAEIPANRHYFFPPQIPDIAEHAEHHHGGHVASRVRYTIRAPGAQVWHPPFTAFGHGFRGCYDIRLVRMEGPPYTRAELVDAVRHCSLVDEMWRTLVEGLESGTLSVAPVRGFGRDWYESRAWERLRPYTMATGAPAEAAPA